ncbi:MAG: bifunctional phosphopantothenoylcysteine decarboxylase/phosphopantothenate--cysteine ligase CoaBC [Phycisphaerales bacterium]|nr:bifunctional phosphopantothenoylcysteine decarboxylase/phosphopantothenate--cysteine ligase CoaBC [Phycisphaerales bacterium]
MLQGKKILLAITGSIAAYKSIFLLRSLIKEGATVQVILTPSAVNFVSPLVLETLSKNKVLIGLSNDHEWSNHVMLGRWADVMLVAPLSCNSLAKMAMGICDNLLMATYLSATCPVVVAPAMDEDMWKHPTVKNNLHILQQHSVRIVPVGHGELASGLYGDGRMAEPAELLVYLVEHCFRNNRLQGKRVVITAGPTIEPIDPVRFIANSSSGTMGIALAESFYLDGATVELILGPVAIKPQFQGITVSHVRTADDMFTRFAQVMPQSDIFIMCAAVADYKVENLMTQKMKKNDGKAITLSLIPNIDILSYAGQHKQAHQFVVGFALETNNGKDYALKKLASKNADMIVLNSLEDKGAGFGYGSNKITIFDKQHNVYPFELKSKKEVANDIRECVFKKMQS